MYCLKLKNSIKSYRRGLLRVIKEKPQCQSMNEVMVNALMETGYFDLAAQFDFTPSLF